LQDSFCMLSFLRLIGLRINGSMLEVFGRKLRPQDVVGQIIVLNYGPCARKEQGPPFSIPG
jgi:hypothetical protein